MANAIRARTVQKGIDPRDYSLVAFGGAGPLHGAEVAQMLGIPEVVVPPYPGITSAIGLLTTDLKYDIVRTAFLVSTDAGPRAPERRSRGDGGVAARAACGGRAGRVTQTLPALGGRALRRPGL